MWQERQEEGRDSTISAGVSGLRDGGSGFSSTRLTAGLPAELFSSVSCLSLAALVGRTSTAPRALPTPPGNHCARATPGAVTPSPRMGKRRPAPGPDPRLTRPGGSRAPPTSAWAWGPSGHSVGTLWGGWSLLGGGESPQVYLVPGAGPELFPGETLISVPFPALPGTPGLGGADAGSGEVGAPFSEPGVPKIGEGPERRGCVGHEPQGCPAQPAETLGQPAGV